MFQIRRLRCTAPMGLNVTDLSNYRHLLHGQTAFCMAQGSLERTPFEKRHIPNAKIPGVSQAIYIPFLFRKRESKCGEQPQA